MSITIHCPYCNQKYELDDFKEGAKVECAKCSQKFTLDMMLVDVDTKTKGKPLISSSVPDNSKTKSQPHREPPEKKTVEKGKEKSPFRPKHRIRLSSVFTNILLLVIALLLIVLCMQINKTNNQINNKLDALSPKSNPITGYKLIDYTWEYESLMDLQFKNAINEGYEPVGYVCQNSIKGGFFLFIKREK